MKKILALILALLLVVGTFAACDSVEKETDAPKEEQSEVDESETEKESEKEKESNEKESESDEKENESDEKESNTEDGGNTENEGVVFRTLNVDGNNVSGVFSNATVDFDFKTEIIVSGDLSYVVSLDKYGMQSVVTKKVPLAEGDNIFYIIVNRGDDYTTYTVTLRRTPMYVVRFNTNGGTSVADQTVEEGSNVRIPTVTKVGYTFVGWDIDLSLPITESITASAIWTTNNYTVTFVTNGGVAMETQSLRYQQTLPQATRTGYTFGGWYSDVALSMAITTVPAKDITVYAKWTTNNDTPYRVEHYTEKTDGSYELRDTDNLFGTSDSEVTPNTKTYFGFFAPEKQTVTLSADGSRVVKYYYIRGYIVTFVTNGGVTMEAQTLRYQQTLPQATRTGYTFGGWYTDVALSTAITTVPANDITVYAYWTEENKSTDFSYSGTSGISITDYVGSDSTVVIPEYIGGVKVTSIGYRAFYRCFDLTSVMIPNSVTSIDYEAFYYCDNLTSVTIGNNVTSIGSSAFSSCFRLMSVYYDGDIASWCNISFVNEGANPVNYARKLYIKKSGMNEYELLINLVIPDSVTKIKDYAFRACDSLMSVTIGNSVERIGEDAFYSCDSLTSVAIGNSVTSIGYEAFAGCYKLVEVINKSSLTLDLGSTSNGYVAYYALEVHDGESKIKTQSDYQFYTVGGVNYLFNYIGSDTELTLPANYNGENYVINDYAFYNNNKITKVTIPDGVTSIGDYAFSGCNSLTSVTIGNGVKSIGEWAFAYCDNPTSITIPDSVTSIGDFAFYGCSSLMSVTIPNSVTSIGSYAFSDCSNLTSIKYRGTETQWANISADVNIPSSCVITYNYTGE